MTIDNSTRSKIQNLVDAIVKQSDKDSFMSAPGWAVIRNPKPSPAGEIDDPGLFLVGDEARLYVEALRSLETDEAVEHLTRAELDGDLTMLVQDLDTNKEQLIKKSARRQRIAEFVTKLSKPPEKYEAAFSIEWAKFPIEPFIIGGVEFREFTQELAIEWGYETVNDFFQEMFDDIIGQPVGIVTVYAGTFEKAADRAQASLDRALNTLRVICIGSAKRVAFWDEQLLQRRGKFRVIRKVEPDTGAISIGGGRIRNPIALDLTGRLGNSIAENADLLSHLYNGKVSDKFRDALLRSLEWIGVSITREIYDHKVVDLCTALEAMLSSIDDQRKGEAISLRYLLLAIAVNENFFDLRQIYDLYLLRSRVIHGAALGECGSEDYIRLRAITIEAMERIIKLNNTHGPFNKPIDFIRFLESQEHLEKAIEWLEKWSDSATRNILNYAKNKL